VKREEKYSKSSLSKILRSEKRKRDLNLLEMYKEIGISQVAFQKYLQLKTPVIERMGLCKKIASVFSLDYDLVVLSISGVNWISDLLYERTELLQKLREIYSKSDSICSVEITTEEVINQSISKEEEIKKLYFSGFSIREIMEKTGRTLHEVNFEIKMIKRTVEPYISKKLS